MEKPHPDCSAREVLPDRPRKSFCQVQWDFSQLHKIRIYLQPSAWAWQTWPEIKIKINGLNRPRMLGAHLAEGVQHSYKIKRITEAFFQGVLPVWKRRFTSTPTPWLNTKHTQTSARSRGYSVLKLSPCIGTLSASVTRLPSPGKSVLSWSLESRHHVWLNTASCVITSEHLWFTSGN